MSWPPRRQLPEDAGRAGQRSGGPEMTCTVHVAWDEELAGYDFGPGHPLAPVRVELTIALARALGVLDAPGVSVQRPALASDAELRARARPGLHRRGAAAGRRADPAQARLFGLGTERRPGLSRHARGVGARRGGDAGRGPRGLDGRSRARGQHRRRAAPRDAGPAPAASASTTTRPSPSPGCCRPGAERIAYVDIDVHHGDGVQAAFYDDPRVLTISLHETPARLFPGTGRPSETGGPDAPAQPSTSRCPAGPATPAGCGRSTRSSRRCCARSRPRSWSASTAATPTGSTRSPTCS